MRRDTSFGCTRVWRLLCKCWDKARTSAATDAATVGPLVISWVHGRTSQEHHEDLKGLMLEINRANRRESSVGLGATSGEEESVKSVAVIPQLHFRTMSPRHFTWSEKATTFHHYTTRRLPSNLNHLGRDLVQPSPPGSASISD